MRSRASSGRHPERRTAIPGAVVLAGGAARLARLAGLARLGRLARARASLGVGPEYPAETGDLRQVRLAGLTMPLRASVAIALVTFVVLFDYSRTFLPENALASGRTPAALALIAVERLILFGLVPLAVVVLAFRDRPARYGLSLGDWRMGSSLAFLGCLLMTPVVLWFAGFPESRVYYGPSSAPVDVVVLTNLVDLGAAEFLFRGFLMMTLVRAIGPLGVLVATLPFVYVHLGKPELELLSTLGGGLVYGWLAWHTRSVVWGALGHVYILSLVTLAAGWP